MPYTLTAYRGYGHETLCFRALEDAQRFMEFVRIYMYESGGGSRNGAYWLFDQKIERAESVPRKAVTRLDGVELDKMMRNILVSRTCNDPPRAEAAIRHGELDGAIVFRTDPLPPRQRPTVGNLCRVFVPHPEATYEERGLGDLRVFEDLGDSLVVIRHMEVADDGQPKRHAKRVTIKTGLVMKIDDWIDWLGF